MNVYVWSYVDQCTTHYHSGGGVVVFAETLERARELANKEPGCEIAEDELPDKVVPCSACDESVHVMPNAGCC